MARQLCNAQPLFLSWLPRMESRQNNFFIEIELPGYDYMTIFSFIEI